MEHSFNILVTGAAGFIGSCLVTELNHHGYNGLFLADNFDKPDKDRYLSAKSYVQKIESSDVFTFLSEGPEVHFVFHLGGKTAGNSDFDNQNVKFPQSLFEWCCNKGVPFVYASSSSVYGAGDYGYADDESLIGRLNPLNDYGVSKNKFDKWILDRGKSLPWAGLRIFNVFGPNEYHKGLSASVAFKSYFEIKETGKVVLFGSSSPDYRPGDQLRDFIYVKDVVKIFYWFLERWIQSKDTFPSGIFNAGTGVGRSFNDVAGAVFDAMNLPGQIEYKPIPEVILNSYPECTVAPVSKLINAGFTGKMHSLEEGVQDMVKNYLACQKYY